MTQPAQLSPSDDGVAVAAQRARPEMRDHLRAVAAALAAACAATSLYRLQVADREPDGWWLLLAALILGIAAQVRLRYPALPPQPPPLPASLARRIAGVLVALAGAAWWAIATLRIYRDWAGGFDFAWIGWALGATLIGIGLDLAWGVWPREPTRRWGPGVLLVMAVLLAVAAVYRLGNIADFPGEAAITQIEDLQVGNFGWAYINGYRARWEYLSSTWLAALGIWLGGPYQVAMRVPFAAVSALKVLPLFIWLRLSVGTAGALVGTALLTFSFWDVMLSRIPNNHNALIVAIVFALIAGPVRRGRPSAYALLGFFGGYVLHEYIAYRPLAALALTAAVLWSLRDRAASWRLRVARPLLTLVLLCTMVAPLFLTRIPYGLRNEYLDGWNRARGIVGYYNPNDTWQLSLQRRIDRATNVVRLFTVRGDSSPVRNVSGQPPLIDPVTCGLLVLGIAAALANALRPVFGLTLLGFVITVSGTLILTGNFDVARVGGAVPYVYALAGFGAAAVWTTWSLAWGRAGRALAALLLAAAVGYAGYWCSANLHELWTNPIIRRSHRNNLAYLTIWLRDHVSPNERVLGIAPGYSNALEGHDGSWLRGRQVAGFIGWDIESTLRQWEREPGPTVLFVYAGHSTPAIAQFLEALFPELKFQIDVDPLDLQADVAWARLPGAPPELADRLADWHCRGVHAEFTLTGTKPGEVLFKTETVAPFVCKSTWPASVPENLYRLTTRPNSIRARYTSAFRVKTAGNYRFTLETYAGSGSLTVDNQRHSGSTQAVMPLTAGLHSLEVTAQFAPMAMEPVIRLLWGGPDTGDQQELMPFYRLAPIDPSCAAAAGQDPFSATTSAPRRYLTNWLALGTFDSPNGSGMQRDFIDVAQLSTDPQAAAASGQRWAPIPARDSFIDLDGFYAPAAENQSPQWVCAYAATTLSVEHGGDAFLELAGSSDALEVWLNGSQITATPLIAGYEPMRRPIALRDGANLLVVKSCEQIGAWYFVARLTDGNGRDLDGVQSAAALSAQPIAIETVPPEQQVQLIDGMANVVFAPHSAQTYGDYRGGGPSWWAYVEDKRPEVVWRTAPIFERRPIIVALTASTSPENGDAQLYVDGQAAVAFRVGSEGVGKHWDNEGYSVAFVSRGFHAGNSGILLVAIPAEAVTPGEPLELRVALTSGAPRTWFMVKSYPDTVVREQLTAASAQGELQSTWERAR